jgi:signal transduction histidine kinase
MQTGAAMHPYVAIPLVACIASAMVVVAILNRDRQDRANRLAALLVLGACLWSFCEVLWNTASEAGTVLWLVRASTLGWVWFGPLGLHFFVELAGLPAPRLRRWLPALYGTCLVFLLLTWTTPWMHPRVEPTSWGWGYVLGPAYWGYYPFTIACLVTGLGRWLWSLRRSSYAAERRQLRWLVPGFLVPMLVASLTDGILPALGMQPPRLGTASLAVFGMVILWGSSRHGYSLLAPGTFAPEILETLPAGVLLLRFDGRIRAANRGIARLVGSPAPSLRGTPIAELLPGLRFDPTQEPEEQECELRRRSGEPIAVSISSSILRDKRRLPIGLVLVVRDLREVAALRSRLVTSGRLAAVGELAAGIAHEINNPIAYIRSNLATLRSFLGEVREKGATDAASSGWLDFDEAESLVDESLDGVDRIGSIVRDVKGFSHAGRGSRQLVDLNELLDAALRIASPQLRYTSRVERRFAEIPLVHGEPQEFKQVFLNLILNASHAIREGGTIRLITEHWGGFSVVRVEDDGSGMEADVIERAFDPFFTTKPVGEGTGLGLAISYQIVHNHGGDIALTSQPGSGTCVRVRLPAASTEGTS